MKAVLDTNVVVSAFLRGGKPGLLIQAAEMNRLRRFTSHDLIAEFMRVAGRRKFARTLLGTNLTVDELVTGYSMLATVVVPSRIARTVSDPDDDVVLATADAAQADFIVTGDHQLLGLTSYQDMLIVNAAEALSRMEATSRPRLP